MSSRRFDVIVVGGGPAGVAAAKASAKTGAKTLLLERNPAIMAVKPCGQAVSAHTFETAGVKPTSSMILNRVSARVYAPNGRSVKIPETGYLINKTLLLQEIAAHAAEYGAEIHVNEPFISFARRGDFLIVKTPKAEYECSALIGADGYNSRVARALGVNERSEPIPTLQYLMAGSRLESIDEIRIYVGNEIAPRGYAWLFPFSDRIAEIGLGVRGAPLKPYMDRVLRMLKSELGSAQVIDNRGAPVPVGGVISKYIFDHVILIGDAAGMVIPMTGGGIHSSIAAGIAAGEVVGEASQEGETSEKRLRSFDEKYRPWLERIRRSLRVLRVIEGLSDEDLNELAEILDDEDIVDLANGLNVGRVARKLISHPRLAVKLAKQLLSI
ncbi:MAG: NAD(P)/FAD-dependent oxidoreductase [Thermofilaceae archaeon]